MTFNSGQFADAWERGSLARESDATLIEAAAAAIAAPKVSLSADVSFVIHAPLELIARALLLRHVALEKREDARQKIAEIAIRYGTTGPEIEEEPALYDGVDTALPALLNALRVGDPSEVDRSLLFLLPRLSFRRLRSELADDIASALGAAAHAPILLAAGVRLDFWNGILPLVRAPLRYIALSPQPPSLSWMDGTIETSSSSGAEELFERLASAPRISVAGYDIASMVLGVERDRFAESVLADATAGMNVRAAKQVLLRTAALSMLCDNPDHAPYGWTHCLTLPQAILDLEDVVENQERLVRIAATHVLAFRATMGTQRLRWNYVPNGRPTGYGELFDVEPEVAATVAYHLPESKIQAGWTLLATRAATQSDAHLVKYTLACINAAIEDPEAARLFLAAAAFLGAWWDGKRSLNPGVTESVR